MRAWRNTFYASFLALLIGSIWSAPAAADELTRELVEAPASQSLRVSPNLIGPSGIRQDPYSVTILSVVQWPSSDHDVTTIGDFGVRYCRGCSYFHEGDDFNPNGGEPVWAVADGTVLFSGWSGGLGESVTIAHTVDAVYTETVYGHMQSGSLMVTQGQQITRGTVLGLVGDTGASTGNHLHFEVHVGGVAIDPMPWLTAHVNDAAWDWLE